MDSLKGPDLQVITLNAIPVSCHWHISPMGHSDHPAAGEVPQSCLTSNQDDV